MYYLLTARVIDSDVWKGMSEFDFKRHGLWDTFYIDRMESDYLSFSLIEEDNPFWEPYYIDAPVELEDLIEDILKCLNNKVCIIGIAYYEYGFDSGWFHCFCSLEGNMHHSEYRLIDDRPFTPKDLFEATLTGKADLHPASEEMKLSSGDIDLMNRYGFALDLSDKEYDQFKTQEDYEAEWKYKEDVSKMEEDRVKAYFRKENGNEEKFFCVKYDNPVIKELLVDHKWTSSVIDNPFDIHIDGIISGYAGVRTIDEFTDTLISLLAENGEYEGKFPDEFRKNIHVIRNSFQFLDGFSQETCDYSADEDGLMTGYIFSICQWSVSSRTECWVWRFLILDEF